MAKAKPKRATNPEVSLPSQRLAVYKPPPRQLSDLEVLAQAARDPRIDPVKLKELNVIMNEQRERAAFTAWSEAMSTAQRLMEPVRKNCTNPSTHSKYASYAALDNAVRKHYTEQGLSLSFDSDPKESTDRRLMMTCDVSKGAYTRRYHFPIPIVTKGPQGKDVMTETHAGMSAKTYGRRALLGMIFNIAEFSDDDGNFAGGNPQITATQLIELEKLVEHTGADLDKFLVYMCIDELAALPANRFEDAKAALRSVANRRSK